MEGREGGRERSMEYKEWGGLVKERGREGNMEYRESGRVWWRKEGRKW